MITISAVKHCDQIFTGKRHHNAIHEAVAATGIKPVRGGKYQGFLDEKGNYLTREEAAVHALECGQIKELKWSETELFSEDLW